MRPSGESRPVHSALLVKILAARLSTAGNHWFLDWRLMCGPWWQTVHLSPCRVGWGIRRCHEARGASKPGWNAISLFIVSGVSRKLYTWPPSFWNWSTIVESESLRTCWQSHFPALLWPCVSLRTAVGIVISSNIWKLWIQSLLPPSNKLVRKACN